MDALAHEVKVAVARMWHVHSSFLPIAERASRRVSLDRGSCKYIVLASITTYGSIIHAPKVGDLCNPIEVGVVARTRAKV